MILPLLSNNKIKKARSTMMMDLISRGIVPIRKKYLSTNHRFALQFREGFVFGRVIKRRPCQYNPWPLTDNDGDAVDLAPGGAQGEVWFRDTRNSQTDILYLDSTTKAGFPWILHGAFGIWPSNINMYLRFPEGDNIPGKFPNVDPVRPGQGDNLGFVNYENSPIEVPTDHVECVIPPLEHIGAEFYNKETTPAPVGIRNTRPVVNIEFALYFLQIFRPETQPDIIADIANGRKLAHFLTVGFGDQCHSYGDQLEADWRVEPMGLDEACALGGGR